MSSDKVDREICGGEMLKDEKLCVVKVWVINWDERGMWAVGERKTGRRGLEGDLTWGMKVEDGVVGEKGPGDWWWVKGLMSGKEYKCH